MRSQFHTFTVPPQITQASLDSCIQNKDPRETKELIDKLIHTGKEGPNLFEILISSSTSLKLKIPDTLCQLHGILYYLYSDQKELVKIVSGEG